MSTAFAARERTAAFGFITEDDGRFIATREAIGVLADWAAVRIGLDEAERSAYADRLIGALAGGAIEHDIVVAVGADVERADRKADNPVGQARAVLARALAEASARQMAASPGSIASTPASAVPEQPKHVFWGWTV